MPPHPSALKTAVVTPSDTVDLPKYAERLYIGGAGNVALQAAGDEAGDTRVFKGLAAGDELEVAATRVLATGTTATDIVAVLHDLA